jgi:fluorothreonine transaldolase
MNNSYDKLPDLEKILKELEQEELKDKETLHLTANESVISPMALKWSNSILNTRYVLGSLSERDKKEAYFFKKNFLVRGIPSFDKLELLAKKTCEKLFHCQASEFGLLSGMHTMISVISSLTKPNDLIMTLPSQYGGHYATARLIKKLGRKHLVLPYNVDEFCLDIEKLKAIGRKEKISMIYLDTMYYFKPYPLEVLREIFPQATIIYDGSHILGLIAGGQFQNPLKEGADILSGNTHKTLPGPQKGMILYQNKELAEKINPDLSSYFISSRHTGSTISLFITLFEMENFGKDYAKQVIKNSQTLAEALFKQGFKILAYPKIKPATHQILILINDVKESLKLIASGISINAGSAFNNQSFIRLGTQQVTRLGMKEDEMTQIAHLVSKALRENKIDEVKNDVKNLRKSFQKIHYTFED